MFGDISEEDLKELDMLEKIASGLEDFVETRIDKQNNGISPRDKYKQIVECLIACSNLSRILITALNDTHKDDSIAIAFLQSMIATVNRHFEVHVVMLGDFA